MISSRRAASAAIAAVIASQLFTATHAVESGDGPYKVEWPSDWEVTEAPGPRPYSEKDIGGRTVKVLKKENGAVSACIALMYFPRRDHGQANLNDEFESFLKTVKKAYTNEKFEIETSAAKSAVLGTLPGIENELTATGKNLVLRQRCVMAISKDFFYQMSFSGLTANFDKYLPEFEKARNSLVLK